MLSKLNQQREDNMDKQYEYLWSVMAASFYVDCEILDTYTDPDEYYISFYDDISDRTEMRVVNQNDVREKT